MRSIIIVFIALVSCTSCSNYHLSRSDQAIPFYDSEVIHARISPQVRYILPGDYFLSSRHASNERVYVRYGNSSGYVANTPSFRRLKAYSKKRYGKAYGSYFASYDANRYRHNIQPRRNGHSYRYSKPASYHKKKTYRSSSSGKSVHVKGYYRRNGTYVRPHTRSAPRKH